MEGNEREVEKQRLFQKQTRLQGGDRPIFSVTLPEIAGSLASRINDNF